MIGQMHQIEEPDVTPLINVNLVVLAMVVLMAASAARLLPLAVPGIDHAGERGQDVSLIVTGRGYAFRGGAGGETLADPAALAAAMAEPGKLAGGWTMAVSDNQLGQAVDALAAVSAVSVNLADGAGRDRLARAVRRLRGAGLRVVLDKTCAITLTVGRESYALAGRSGLNADELAEAVAGLDEGTIILVHMDGDAPYERLVRALEPIMSTPGVEVAFGQADGVKVVSPDGGGAGRKDGT